MEMLLFPLCCVSPALTGVMFGLCFVYSAHLVPSSSSVCPSSYCLSLKPGAQAAHQLTATELPGPPEASALSVCRQINEVFAFLRQSGAFRKVSEGGFPGESGFC